MRSRLSLAFPEPTAEYSCFPNHETIKDFGQNPYVIQAQIHFKIIPAPFSPVSLAPNDRHPSTPQPWQGPREIQPRVELVLAKEPKKKV